MPKPRPTDRLCAWALGSALLAAQAAEPPPVARACQACHGREGVSLSEGIPNLAGQKAGYLAAQLKAFRGGTRKHDLMNPIAAQLSDADIEALASHWSRLPGQGAAGVATLESPLQLPAGFPAGFEEYSREEQAEGQGFAIRFANRAALAAARAGQSLPAGSAIVVENRGARQGADGRYLPGPVQGYAAMESRAGWGEAMPALLRNGDWQYGLFGADGQPRIGNAQAQCLACHLPAAASSYVFTLPLLKRHAGGG